MFNVNDYKTIIEKYWTNECEDDSYIKFEILFSLDIGLGFNSKKERTKWISKFNSLRNNWAHEASKNTGLSKEEVTTLKIMYNHCYQKFNN